MNWLSTRLTHTVTLASQLVNVWLFGGLPDESISGRAHRQKWRVEKLIDWLFWWQPAHCRKAHEEDRKFARLVLFNDKR